MSTDEEKQHAANDADADSDDAESADNEESKEMPAENGHDKSN